MSRSERRSAVPDGQHVVLQYEDHSETWIARVRQRAEEANGTLEIVTEDESNPYPPDGEWPDGERIAKHPELASGVLSAGDEDE